MAPKRKAQTAAVVEEEAVVESSGPRRSGRNHPIVDAKAKKPAAKKSKKSAELVEQEEDAPEKAPSPPKEDPAPEPEAPVAEKEAKDVYAIGDAIPGDIKVKTQEDKEVSVAGLVADKGAVIFLVPKANTPGCTTQACSFRDSYKEFEGLNYNVFSLSQDSPKALTSWKNAKELSYELLSDPNQALIKPLGGSAGAKKVTRSHFVLEAKTGKLLLQSIGVKPAASAEAALKFIKGL